MWLLIWKNDLFIPEKKSSCLYFLSLAKLKHKLNPDPLSLNIASLKAHNAPQHDVTAAINAARLLEDKARPVKLEMKHHE